VKSNDKRKKEKYPESKGVAFFPAVKSMSGNPYWPMLAAGLEKNGVYLEYDTPERFGLKWLFRNRRRIHIIHLHFIQPLYSSNTILKIFILFVLFLSNMILARVFGYRSVFTLHNLEPTFQRKPAWLDYLGHWIAANLSERVIVHCNEARRLLAKRYGRRKGVFFVDHPNFIDYYPNTITKELARNKLNLPANSIVFVFFGGIRPNKGIETLIQAFLKLKSENIRLVIAGKETRPGPYAQSLIEMGSGDNRISFHIEYIPDEEIQVFMNAADIVVLPFAKILTSGSANLAISFARPVIAPRMGCLPELVETDSGWLFEPDNTKSLIVVMQNAITSDYQRTGQVAFNKISAFTPERFAEQTIKAYWD